MFSSLLLLSSSLLVNSATWTFSYNFTGDEGKHPLYNSSGKLHVLDKPDENGFYEVVGIEGVHHGVPIKALTPKGESIPGNEPYKVDNLIRPVSVSHPGQLTEDGIGFSLEDGTYANPMFVTFETPNVYLDFFSGMGHSNTTELNVTFVAERVPTGV
mmetsp:Transcript_8788/g.13037  ORF Transcript_8788/g.13037 Transcript_8788/m.13037 type:complete len:157 (+) Transcript_8788:1-471(+)